MNDLHTKNKEYLNAIPEKIKEVAQSQEYIKSAILQSLGNTLSSHAIETFQTLEIDEKIQTFLSNVREKIYRGEKLTKEELMHLYSYDIDPRDSAFSLSEKALPECLKQVSWTEVWEGALNFKGIQELPDNFRFPKHIKGTLNLQDLKKLSKNIILPEIIDGNIVLDYLEECEDGIKFPEKVKGMFFNSSFEKFPQNIIPPKQVEVIQGSEQLTKIFHEKMGSPNCVYFPHGGLHFNTTLEKKSQNADPENSDPSRKENEAQFLNHKISEEQIQERENKIKIIEMMVGDGTRSGEFKNGQIWNGEARSNIPTGHENYHYEVLGEYEDGKLNGIGKKTLKYTGWLFNGSDDSTYLVELGEYKNGVLYRGERYHYFADEIDFDEYVRRTGIDSIDEHSFCYQQDYVYTLVSEYEMDEVLNRRSYADSIKKVGVFHSNGKLKTGYIYKPVYNDEKAGWSWKLISAGNFDENEEPIF